MEFPETLKNSNCLPLLWFYCKILTAMKNFSITVMNQEGLHARPASRLVQLCHSYSSQINISFNHTQANAKNITEVLSLGVEDGDTIEISIEGQDELEVFQQLSAFFKNKITKLKNY